MNYSISDLCIQQKGIDAFSSVPTDIGLELFLHEDMRPGWHETLVPILKDGRYFSVHAYPDIMNAKADDTECNKRMNRSVEIAAGLDAKFLVLHPTYGHGRTDAAMRGDIMKRIDGYNQMARDGGVLLAVENLFPDKNGYLSFDQAQFIDLINALPGLHCLIDVGHALLSGWDLADTIKCLHNRIVAYHIHDNDGVRDCHNRINTGILDLKRFMTVCWEMTPRAVLVLEYEKHVALAQSVEDIRTLQQMI